MKKHFKKISVVLCVAIMCVILTSLSAMAALEPVVIDRNVRSKFDGFDFEFWIQNRGEDASMTLTGGGTFECEWEGVFNVLFRMGKRLGSISSYEEYGEVILEYAAEYELLGGSVFYLCVYGWTQNPLVEWYIIESRGSYKPPGGVALGIVEIDGGTYEIFESTRTNMPSIEGDQTFQQYWSVRTENRSEGTITISDHFKAWEEYGMDMSGNMYEVSLCIEGFRSSGNAKVTRNVLKIGDEVYGADTVLLTGEDEPVVVDDVIDAPPEDTDQPNITELPVADGNNDANSNDNSFPLVPVIAGGVAVVVIGGAVTAISVKRRK